MSFPWIDFSRSIYRVLPTQYLFPLKQVPQFVIVCLFTFFGGGLLFSSKLSLTRTGNMPGTTHEKWKDQIDIWWKYAVTSFCIIVWASNHNPVLFNLWKINCLKFIASVLNEFIVKLEENGNVCMHGKLLQSCRTLWDPMDCSPPGSSVCGDSPGKNTAVGCHALLQGIFLTQGLNLCLLCLLDWQAGSLP